MKVQRKERIRYLLNVFLSILGLSSVGLGIIHFGFELPPESQRPMRLAIQTIVIGFALQEVARWFIRPGTFAEHLKLRWVENGILALLTFSYFGLESLASWSKEILPMVHPEDLLLGYLFVTQTVVFATLLLRVARASNIFAKIPLGPGQLFVISFATPVLMGTLLLKLPKATFDSISWVDALFMSTSAVCVTGLAVFDTSATFTPLGQTILLCLFQLGGLGIMTMTMGLSVFFSGGLGVRERMYLGDLLAEERMGEVGRLLKRITLTALTLELMGALALYHARGFTLTDFQLHEFVKDVFHAVSAFCNAGFSLFSASLHEPPGVVHTYPFLSVIMVLVILGGLGFPVLANFWSMFSAWRGERTERVVLRFSSKIVLLSTFILIVFGTLVLYFSEGRHSFGELPFFERLYNSLFLATTSRTAGFNMWPTESLGMGTCFIVIVLMWIGGGPMSTAGGVKTVTISVAFFSLISVIKGHSRVEALGREISQITINRSYAVIVGSLSFLGLGTLVLVILEPNMSGLDLLFEATSAFGTVGLSRGVTAHLSDTSKFVLTAMMFIGRVGLLTFISSLIRFREEPHYRLLKENFPIH